MAANPDTVRLFKAELELCKVTPDETVSALTEGEEKHDYANTFLTATEELGATTFQLNLVKRNSGRRACRRPVIRLTTLPKL